jgi:hypothetical protein
MSQPEGDHNNPNNAREPLPSPPEAADATLVALPDLLLRPLGDDVEMRHIFRGDIEERLRHAEVRKGELSPEQAVKWLAAQPGVIPSRKPWLLPLLVIAALLTFVAVVWEGYNFLPGFAAVPTSPPLLRQWGEKQLYVIPARRADNPLLEPGHTPATAAEACWRGHPQDPVLYYYYVSSLADSGIPLPADYDATWRSIDPDNAFWLLLQARLALTPPPLIVRGSFSSSASGPPPPPADIPRVVALLVKASRMPGCHSFEQDVAKFLKAQTLEPETFVQMSSIQIASSMRYMARGSSSWQLVSRQASGSRDELSALDPHGYERVAGWLNRIGEESAAADDLNDELIGSLRMETMFPSVMTMILRGEAIVSAAVFLVLAGVLILRQIPARGRAGRMALCARPLLSPRGLRWLTLKYVAVPVILMAGVEGSVVLTGKIDDDLMGYLVLAPSALMLPALVAMVGEARHEVSRRTAFLGLRSTGFQRKLGWLLLLLALIPLLALLVLLIALATGHSHNSDLEAILATTGGACYGAALLWLGLKWLLGFASPTANVRHRLIASRLVPVMLIATVSLGVFALCLHPVERYLVKKTVSQPHRKTQAVITY